MTAMAPCLHALDANGSTAAKNRRDACALVRQFGDGGETTVTTRLVEAILGCLEDMRFEGDEAARYAAAAELARSVNPREADLALDAFDMMFFDFAGVEACRPDELWKEARRGLDLEMFVPYAGYRRADSVHRKEAARAALGVFSRAERALSSAVSPTVRAGAPAQHPADR